MREPMNAQRRLRRRSVAKATAMRPWMPMPGEHAAKAPTPTAQPICAGDARSAMARFQRSRARSRSLAKKPRTGRQPTQILGPLTPGWYAGIVTAEEALAEFVRYLENERRASVHTVAAYRGDLEALVAVVRGRSEKA